MLYILLIYDITKNTITYFKFNHYHIFYSYIKRGLSEVNDVIESERRRNKLSFCSKQDYGKVNGFEFISWCKYLKRKGKRGKNKRNKVLTNKF